MQDFIARYSYPHLELPGVVVVDSDNGRFMNHSLTPNTDFRVFDKGYALVDIAARGRNHLQLLRVRSDLHGLLPGRAGGGVGDQAACRPQIGRFRFALAACIALAAPAKIAAAEPEPGFAWMVNHGEGNVTLVYGSTETGEDYSFAISCNNKTGSGANLTVYRDIAGAKVGQKLAIEISVRPAKVAIKGKASTDEMSGYVFGVAEKFAVKPVIAVLSVSGPATAKMGKVTVNLPEHGA